MYPTFLLVLQPEMSTPATRRTKPFLKSITGSRRGHVHYRLVLKEVCRGSIKDFCDTKELVSVLRDALVGELLFLDESDLFSFLFDQRTTKPTTKPIGCTVMSALAIFLSQPMEKVSLVIGSSLKK
jgi:hypothetical protein